MVIALLPFSFRQAFLFRINATKHWRRTGFVTRLNRQSNSSFRLRFLEVARFASHILTPAVIRRRWLIRRAAERKEKRYAYNTPFISLDLLTAVVVNSKFGDGGATLRGASASIEHDGYS